MNYFKNTNNQIFAYDDEQVKQGYGKDLTPITEEEKDLILAPMAEQLEAQRVALIKAKAEELITSIYPTYKQLNILMSGIVTDIELMNSYILSIRTISDEAEASGINVEDIQWQ